MIRAGLLALALSGLAACASAPQGQSAMTPVIADIIEIEIGLLLASQQAAWNEGDIEGFMAGYWQSPQLRFGSGGTVTRGWQETLERYQQGYRDRSAMGELSFTDLDYTILSEDAAVLHGRWQLTRDGDAPSGLFTLVLRRFPEGWRIISDTTTSAD